MCTIHFRQCDVRNMNCCQALLTVSTLIKQTLPTFSKRGLGPPTFSTFAQKDCSVFSPCLLWRIRSSFPRILFYYLQANSGKKKKTTGKVFQVCLKDHSVGANYSRFLLMFCAFVFISRWKLLQGCGSTRWERVMMSLISHASEIARQ